jgi:hypothetical protein
MSAKNYAPKNNLESFNKQNLILNKGNQNKISGNQYKLNENDLNENENENKISGNQYKLNEKKINKNEANKNEVNEKKINKNENNNFFSFNNIENDNENEEKKNKSKKNEIENEAEVTNNKKNQTNYSNIIKNTNNNKKVEATQGMFTSAANSITDFYESPSGNETMWLVFKIILGAIFLIIIINIVKYFYLRWDSNKNGSPVLINGTKNGKQAMVISQDPNHTNYIPINRSINKDGIEFSYSFWFVISDLGYKNGEWKHMFHKGNSSSYPNRAPGVWIHPTNNIIRVYMNTMKEMLEYVDIDNIPLRKWVHMVIIVKNRSLHIYVNGFLKIRKELSSLPRQNYGNVWASLFGGFDGYLSQLQYFNYAIQSSEIESIVATGPAQGSCIDTKEKPPYLDDSWWLN